MDMESFYLGCMIFSVFYVYTEIGSLMAGQAAGLLLEVRPV
ncbi:UNVERIFIED_CONTAM: hypothetical protein NY603_41950 [Bacteroidetes bacterium 56_B9]